MKNIQVIEEWILVKPEKTADQAESRTTGGIVIPNEVKKQQEVVKRAEVIQISEDVDRLIKKDKEDPNAVLKYKVGDTVLFYGKTGIPIMNGEYMFLRYSGMLAIEDHAKELPEPTKLSVVKE